MEHQQVLEGQPCLENQWCPLDQRVQQVQKVRQVLELYYLHLWDQQVLDHLRHPRDRCHPLDLGHPSVPSGQEPLMQHPEDQESQ